MGKANLVGSAPLSRRASHRGPGEDEGREEAFLIVDSALQLFLVAAIAAAVGAVISSGGDLVALPAMSLQDGLEGLE